MNASPFQPRDIGPNPDGTMLRIEWADGHVSDFPPRHLRLHCPCAGCVDELTGRKILTEEKVPEHVHPHAIHYVGRYAIQFDWSDGHQTGIFPFDFLRKLCVCPDCEDRAETG